MSDRSPPEWAVRTEADRRALLAGCYWDADAAGRVVRFAETYITQKYGTGAFRLFPWQVRFLQSLYGWRKPDGHRRFRTAVLHVPKKNGKTLLISVLAAYELFAAGQPSPLVVSASTTKGNAAQVYEQLVSTIKAAPKLSKLAKAVPYQKTIRVASTGGEYRALSADAPSSEGLNCTAVIVDEAHAHRSEKLWRTVEHATIGREDGLTVVISTAGDDLTHWYYALVVQARAVLAGADLDQGFYAEVYEADPLLDDLDSPATWLRVNPSLDQYPAFTAAGFGERWAAAKATTANRLSYERYRLNIFRRPEDAQWIDLARWDAAARVVPDADLIGRPCWLGLDASQRVDPTSLSAVWLMPGNKFHVKSWAWVAEAGVRDREQSNLPRYQQFAEEGAMEITPGDVMDKERIRAKIEELRAAGHDVKALVMDPNGLWVFGTELAATGLDVQRMSQNFKQFNDPTRSFEEAVLGGRVSHDGGTWLRWCLHSVRLDTDSYENVRPVKGKSADHIDGAISTLMAFALADRATAPDPAGERPPAVFLV